MFLLPFACVAKYQREEVLNMPCHTTASKTTSEICWLIAANLSDSKREGAWFVSVDKLIIPWGGGLMMTPRAWLWNINITQPQEPLRLAWDNPSNRLIVCPYVLQRLKTKSLNQNQPQRGGLFGMSGWTSMNLYNPLICGEVFCRLTDKYYFVSGHRWLELTFCSYASISF